MITILDYTTKEPLNMIGQMAGVCWNSPINDKEKNIKRAKACISSGHGRVMEYPDVYCVIENFSARCLRELYTHVIGTTRLQSSTRYVDAKNMDINTEFYYPVPNQDFDDILQEGYIRAMDTYRKLEEVGMTKEDAANILPLGMHTKVVWKINLRALVHFANERLCSRAYKEIRVLVNELKKELSKISPEWEWICENLLVPKCEAIGYCSEAKSCGRKITRKEMEQAVDFWKGSNPPIN
jgi:thymidylate synthase (FAD)